MRNRAVVALAALLLAPAACSDDGPGQGEARLEVVDGRVVVERADGDRETVDDATNVGPGDRVTVQEGVATMRMAGGTVLELREGLADGEAGDDRAAADTAVVMGTRPVLEAGDLLVSTEGSFGVEADGTDVEVTEGSARVTRALGMSVAAYDADVALDSAGVQAEVPALRQMVVPDLGRPARDLRPITPNRDDTWDLRLLGAAMALGDRLDNFADGFTPTIPPGEGRTAGFFKLVYAGLEDEPDFVDQLLQPYRDNEPGDTLIGAAIADLGERGDFDERWQEVFDFHDDGAEWGIVALDQAVRSDPLLGSIEDALDSFAEAPEFVLSLEPGASDSGSGSPPTDDASGDGPDGGGTPTTQPGTQPPPVTTLPPPVTTPTLPPIEPAEELAPVVDPVTDLVDDLVGGLLGGLLGGG